MATPLAALLPEGKQQFLDGSGDPLALGLVYFYEPGTTTPMPTWQDAQETALNTNPVQLDAGGWAVIYGNGQYRQVVQTAEGVTIWDQLVQDAVSIAAQVMQTGTGYGQDVGTTNGLVVNFSPAFASLAGLLGVPLRVRVADTNTGGSTINVNGLGAVSITNPDGTALQGGELQTGGIASLVYDGSEFQLQSISSGPPAAGPSEAYVQEQPGNWALDTGSPNALAVTLNPAPGSLAVLNGAPVRVYCQNNNTGASTLNVNGLGASAIVGTDGQLMGAGDLLNGIFYTFIYAAGPNRWVLQSERSSISPPSYGLFASIADVTGARGVNIVYTNTTGKPMFVAAAFTSETAFEAVTMVVNGVQGMASFSTTTTQFLTVAGMVPPGGNYECAATAAMTVTHWAETS